MKVTFKHQGLHLASARYRSMIPAQELAKQGIGPGNDWLVIGKHGWKWDEVAAGFSKVCYDVCDSHWNDRWANHYYSCIRRADLVTCNSKAMRDEIEKHTGRHAVIIPDPWEQRERPPRISDRLLWFGHAVNLADLAPLERQLSKYPIEIISNLNARGVTQWSPEAMDRAFDRCGLVVIPTGRSAAKSGNRAIESLRRGLFPVCGPLPAYADLGVWIGDIEEGVHWALSHQDEVLSRIKAAQSYIRHEYSPARIGKLWKDALELVQMSPSPSIDNSPDERDVDLMAFGEDGG